LILKTWLGEGKLKSDEDAMVELLGLETREGKIWAMDGR
jgi:hypothetical protein